MICNKKRGTTVPLFLYFWQVKSKFLNEKKILLIIVFIIQTIVFSQSSDCNAPMPICGNISPIPTVVDIPSVGTVGCLSTTPNPSWFIFKVATPGDLVFTLSQGNNSPDYNNLDIDFICWGPFTTDNIDCENGLYGFNGNTTISSNVVDCSYSASNTETVTVNNVLADEYYVILTTNFSNQAGFFKIEQTNIGSAGAASINCDFVCGVSLGPDQIVCSTSFNGIDITANFNQVPTIPGQPTYNWYLNNVYHMTTSVPTINVSQPGTWKVITTRPGCIDQAEDEIMIIVDNSVIDEVPFTVDAPLADCNPYFDLTSYEGTILNGNDPSNYIFTYYLDEIDSLLEINEINDTVNFSLNENTTIYVTIRNVNTNCLYFTSFLIDIDCPSTEIVINNQPEDQNVEVNNNATFSTNADNTVTFQWQMRVNGETNWSNLVDGGIFIGANTNALQINQVPISFDGNAFRLMMTSTTDLKYSDVAYLNVSTLSIDDFDSISFVVYPNPVNDSFTLELGNIFLDNSIYYTIFDLNGRKVFGDKIYHDNTQINIETLQPGIYFIEVITKDKSSNKKIFKK